MTQQINAYLATREQIRSNLAREAENYRHNVVSEQLELDKHRESRRHNVESEYLTAQQTAVRREELAHSYATLQHSKDVLAETRRANKAQEALKSFQNTISSVDVYGNLAVAQGRLKEEKRANLVQQNLRGWELSQGDKRIAISQQEADTNRGGLWNNLVRTGKDIIGLFR